MLALVLLSTQTSNSFSKVILRYYESNTTTCFLEPWFREIGFAFFYGSIIIKVRWHCVVQLLEIPNRLPLSCRCTASTQSFRPEKHIESA